MQRLSRDRLILSFTVFVLSAAVAVACELQVRDAAFRAPRDVHRLCVMARADDSQGEAIAAELKAWLEGPGRDLNIEVEQVAADDPEVNWEDYAVPSAPPNLPVVALVGKNYGDGSSFYISHWEPGPNADDLSELKSSPLRDTLREKLGENLAVLLYAPGDTSENEATRTLLDEAVKKWSASTPLSLSVVTIDRSDSRERLLLSFMGLAPEGEDFLGVVFGRGKLMPPLMGSAITKENIDELLEQVVLECSCSKPLPSIGIDIPLEWGEELDANWKPLRDQDDEAEPTSLVANESSSNTPMTSDALASEASASKTPSVAATFETKSSLSGSVLNTVYWTLGVLVGTVVLVSTVIVLRKGRAT